MALTTEELNIVIQQVKAAILAESQGVGELSKATDLTGISSLPALKIIEGVESVVDVPISLLTPNLRVNGAMVQYKDPIAGTWGDIIAVADIQGKSAFDIAVSLGYTGTSAEWIESLKQPAKDAATELASYISNISSNTRRIISVENKTSNQSIVSEEGFNVIDGNGNIGMKYNADGLDVAAFAAHFINLIKSYLDVGIANGIAPLNNSGQIAATYLPSYVDDVVEFDSIIETATITDNESTELGGSIVYISSVARFAYLLSGVYYNEFPNKDKYEDSLLIPLDGKIYINKSTNQQYRWSGTQLSEISSSLALGETESSAFAGSRGVSLENAITIIQGIVSSLSKNNFNLVNKTSSIYSVSEDGFYFCDQNGNIIAKITNSGFDVALLSGGSIEYEQYSEIEYEI